MDISQKAQNKQDKIHRPHETEEGRPKCGCFSSSEKGKNKILTEAITEIKCGAETEGKAIQRLSYLEIHPINSHQTLHYYGRQEMLAQRSLIWLSPRVPARALQVQRQMLASNHWTEHGSPQWKN